jgi:predicted branched-subunit amino acid permease
MAPLAVGDVLEGALFGLIAVNVGWGAGVAITMSFVAFSGSAQFGAASTIAGGGSVLAAVLTAALLNARYLVMGADIAPLLQGGWLRRLVESQLITDAAWAIGRSAGSPARVVGAGALSRLAWTLGTAAGALGAQHLAFGPATFTRLGLDAAYPAFFLYLLVDHLRGTGSRALLVAAAGGTAAVAVAPLVPAGLPILVGCAVGLVVGFWR